MLPSSIRLRSHLVIRRQGTGAETAYVVKNPTTGQFFRLREAEYFIAQQLDGSTPLPIVQQRFEAKFGVTLEGDEIVRFVERLNRLGLLETESQPRDPSPPRKRVRGNLLYLRFKAFDPNQLLDRLAQKARFFFTPYFLILSSGTLLSAFVVTASHWKEITRDIGTLWRFDALLLAWLTVLCVTALHEFAHGLTCKHFGGEVHEMGFMLIYFQPAFYCNVSDAWLFPDKSRRLWVTFAGAYFEIFLWSLATLTWRVVEPGTAVSFLALVVMATSGIKSVFNLNPLIKLDGYYLLSDALEIPNLRQKAFQYLGAQFRKLRRANPANALEAGVRERRIYAIYGVLAGAYSYWLLAWVSSYFGQYLVQHAGGWGVVLFAGFLSILFDNPVRKVFSKLRAAARWEPGKQPVRSYVLLGVVLTVLLVGRLELQVSGEFKILPVQNRDVRAEAEGIIVAVLHEEGDRIGKGDILVRLAEPENEAEFAKTAAELLENRAQLKLLLAGTRPEEIALAEKRLQTAQTEEKHLRVEIQEAQAIHTMELRRAEATWEKAQEQLKYAGSEHERLTELHEAGVIPRQQWEKSQEQRKISEKETAAAEAGLKMVRADDLAELKKQWAVAQEKVQEFTAHLKLLRAGSRPEEIEASRAKIARLEAHREYLGKQLQARLVTSPVRGVLATPYMKEKIGQRVVKGDLIAKVVEVDHVTPEIRVSEKEVADLQVGQPVALRARVHPGETFHGRIKAIAPTADANELGGKVVRVTVEMDRTPELLSPEMTGNAKISCGKRPILSLLGRRIYQYVRVELWPTW